VSTGGLGSLAARASRRGPLRERGFTLIELVTCIIIIGLLAAIAIPRFFDTQPFAEHGYASEIAAALRSARNVAVATSCDVRVTIDAAGAYQALQRSAAGNDCLGAGWTIPVRLPNGSLLAGTPPSGITAAPATIIVIDRNGQVVGPSPVLTVGAFTVRLAGATGFVSVQ
jgi:MSHA pilin protein MshC